MNQSIVFDYLFRVNSIPVWILDPADGLLYASAPREGLRSAENLGKFFSAFVRSTTGEPSFYTVNNIEMFASFRFTEEGTERIAVLGPGFKLQPVNSGYARHLSLDYIYDEKTAKSKILFASTLEPADFLEFARAALYLLQKKEYSVETLSERNAYVPLKHIIGEELTMRIFGIREESRLSIYSYEHERMTLSYVRNGDVEKVTALIATLSARQRGNIVANPYKQTLYEAVALVAIVTRTAVEGGLEADEAYMMSDLYIRRLDATKNTDELIAVVRQMALDFTERVRIRRDSRERIRNKAVKQCVEYVKSHIHYRITLQEAAAYAGITPKYLSAVFQKETGQKFSEYVQKQRVQEAGNLLKFTSMSIPDISSSLAFSSQSYFTKVFFEHMGTTPQKYRERN